MPMNIRPFTSAFGGTNTVRVGGMTSGETFKAGDPVSLVAAGTLTEPIDDATPWLVVLSDVGNISGIAAYGPGEAVEGAGGTTAANINPRTGVVFTALDEIGYWPINEGTVFYTSNFFAAGAGSHLAPVISDIGNTYQISHGTFTFNGAEAGWGVEQNAAVPGVDYQASVLDVLDAQLAPIRRTGNAGTGITFLIEGSILEEN